MTPFVLLGFAGINIEMVFIWVQNIVHHVREELLPKYWQDIRLCLPRCLEKLGECQEQGCANAIMSIILSFKSRTGWITLLKIGEMKQRSSLHFFFLILKRESPPINIYYLYPIPEYLEQQENDRESLPVPLNLLVCLKLTF